MTPAATSFCLQDSSDFPAGDVITIPAANDLRVGDPVVFSLENAAKLDTALTVGTTYYVVSNSAGALQVAVSPGGTPITLNNDGGVAGVPPTTGPIATFDTAGLTAGAAYTDGSYTGVALTGGTGTGATADITVAGGVVTIVTLAAAGTGYTAGDSLSAADADLGGGGGTGFAVDVATLNLAAAGNSDTSGAHINLNFAESEAACQVSSVSLSLTRGEVDTTSLPCGVQKSSSGIKMAQFRTFQGGYANGTGTLTVRFTADASSVTNRIIENSLFVDQSGAVLECYLNAVADASGLRPDPSKSLLVSFPVSLLGFDFTITPEDTPTEATINFRLSGQPFRMLN